jgi:plasmid stability protein
MAAVHVRNVPEQVLEALKRRAARHERSLQRELRHVLCAIAEEEPSAAPLPPIELRLSDARPASSWRREEFYGDDGR